MRTLDHCRAVYRSSSARSSSGPYTLERKKLSSNQYMRTEGRKRDIHKQRGQQAVSKDPSAGRAARLTISVLSSTGVALSGRVDSDGIQGAKVTGNPRHLFFEDDVPESSLEPSLTSRGGRDVHGFLTTSYNHVGLCGVDGC